MSGRPRAGNDDGSTTVEAAIAIASIVTVVALCVGAIAAAAAQVRCIDAAREAARLAARGDRADAIVVAERVAPRDSDIEVRQDGAFVVVTVRATVPLLPLVRLSAETVAAREPEAGYG
ncbi:TadE family type IV pilus minor pilin [Rhodococcus spongiicola]|uniref:Pilus assembly protein TadE n=1 Tax=Rhodococcus spongiicola TaxID=2487352 RepID=A0A3S3AHZ1_9NOCA|nr:TadE family type IV pilus minor pilin [Rhodococcus spongiicola]RVW01003.1 pilus assembly protein TadE [Rhodococcus spongiicola]